VTTAEYLAHNGLCILFVGHTNLLRVLCASQVFRLDGQVDGVSGQLPVVSCNIALDTASHYSDDFDIERLQLDSERVAVRVQSGLCRVVHAAKDVGHDTSQTTDLDNGTLGLDQQRCKRLAHAHDTKDIDLVLAQSQCRWQEPCSCDQHC